MALELRIQLSRFNPKYWSSWSDPRLIIIVLNNMDLNMVTWEQRIMNGDPKFEASQNIPSFSYASYARLLDLTGIEVSSPDQISAALEEALTAKRPSVIDVHCDPNVPILPPHITIEQAKGFMSAILGKDPDTRGILSQSLKEGISTIRS